MTSRNLSFLYNPLEELSSVQSKLDYFDLNSQSPEENFNFSGQDSLNHTLVNGTSSPPAGRDEWLAKIEQSVLIIIFTLTIAGNFVVLVGIYFRKQKMTRMYYFILHLAIADLATAVFQVLTQLAWEITYRFRGGPFMCKFVKFVQIIGPYASSYILVMTALDRYQAICFPLSNCSWTARRSKVMLWTAWIFSIACCVPQLFIFSFQEVTTGVYDCWATFIPGWGEKAYITWYCISVFIVPLIILIFAYTCITRVIWLNFSMKNAIIQEQKRSTARDSDEHEFDQSIEENDGSVFRENYKNSEKPSNEKHRLRDIEVSWHNNKSGGPTTKTTMYGKPNELPGIHNKFLPNCETTHPDIINNDGGYSEDKEFVSLHLANNRHIANQNLPCVSSHDSRKNYGEHNDANHSRQTGPDKINSRGIERSTSAPEKRHSWRSASKSSTKQTNGSSHRQLKGPALSLLTPNGKTHQRGSKKSTRTLSVRSPALMSVSQPRTSSIKGISRAKIKTIKLTVTVILCYVVCSTPFIAALLWSAYDPYAKDHPFFYGPTFTILTLLASLNSCANSFIVLFFNPNLLQSFFQGTCGRFRYFSQHPRASSSLSPSQKKEMYNNRFVGKGSNQRAATSVTGLSPLMNRLSPNEYGNNRSRNGHQAMELVSKGSKKVNIVAAGKPDLSSRNENNYAVVDSTNEASSPKETSFIGM